MRRIIIIGTALVVLGAVGVAFAASNYNNYSGTNLSWSKGIGTKRRPVAVSETVNLRAGAPAGHRAAPLFHIRFTEYGLRLDVGKLPVCTDALIEQNKTSPTGGCPKGSLIGTGTTKALLGPGSNSTAVGTPCNPYINVFNGGPKVQVFYFWTKSATDCGGLTTGATAPYDGHILYSGKNVVVDIPLPPDISTKVANQPGLYGSLIAQTVVYGKSVAGKTYGASIACKHGQRPWSVQYTAQKYGGGNETQTVSGSSKC